MNKKFIKLSLATILLCSLNAFGANTDLGTGNTLAGTSNNNTLDSLSNNNSLTDSSNNTIVDSQNLTLINSTYSQYYFSSLITVTSTSSVSNQVYNSYNISFSGANTDSNIVNSSEAVNISNSSNNYLSGNSIGVNDSNYSYLEGTSLNSTSGDFNFLLGKSLSVYGTYGDFIGSGITQGGTMSYVDKAVFIGTNIQYGSISDNFSTVTYSNDIAIGQNLKIRSSNSQTYGYGLTNSGDNSVFFGSASKLTNNEADVFQISGRRLTGLLDPVNASDAVSKSYADTNYLTSSSLGSTLSSYATTASLSNYVTTASLAGYVTTPDLMNYVTNSSLSTTLGGYYTKAQVDTLVASAGGGGGSVANTDTGFGNFYLTDGGNTNSGSMNTVSGSQNNLDGTSNNNRIEGSQNFVVNSTGNYIIGEGNHLTDSTQTAITGFNNTSISSDNVLLEGFQNGSLNSSTSLILGQSSTLYYTTNSMLFSPLSSGATISGSAGSPVDNTVLFASPTQLYEDRSNVFNVGDRRITNVLNPVDSSDAVNKGYLENYTYSQTQINTLISGVSGGSVDLSSYYTKTQVDTIFATKSDLSAVASGGGSGSVSVADKADIVNTANSYTDTSVASAKTELRGEIETSKQEVLNQARGYTDQKFAEADKRAKQYSSLASALSSPLDYSRGSNAFNASVTNVAGMTAVGVSVGKKMPNDVYYNVSVGSTGTYHGAKATVGYSW